MSAPTRAPMIWKDRPAVSVVEKNPPADRPARAWHAARMILSVTEPDLPARMFVWTRPGDPVLETVWRPDKSVIARRTVLWRIVTDDGEWIVTGEPGCASCGNRLAHWDPFSPMRMQIG